MSESESTAKVLKSFTKESLVEHVQANPNNTFISIHDNVYDVTQFLDEHPGGEETLKEQQVKTEFKDATESFEETAHSMDARDIMKKYQIGTMEYKSEKLQAPKIETVKTDQEKSSFLTWAILGILIIVFAFCYQYFSNSS